MRHIVFLFAFAVSTFLRAGASTAAPEPIEELMRQATEAAQRGDHKLAVERLTEVIEKSPATHQAWYLRGRENFRAGRVQEALADFDKFVELEPKAEPQQWERGIACYYAGQFKKGARQFELYQTFHNQDVENAAWRYLCVARTQGVEKARATLLPIEHDPRVPMMQIYELYRGQRKPEDVLAAAEAGDAPREAKTLRRFYAHLYVGLWYEAAGKPDEAREHILKAEANKIGHYMWDVAHVHAERLRAGGQK